MTAHTVFAHVLSGCLHTRVHPLHCARTGNTACAGSRYHLACLILTGHKFLTIEGYATQL